MLVYKSVNVFGGNVTDRYVDASKINAMAAEGWKLIAITAPPNSHNNRYVCGTFVREEATVAKTATVETPAPVEQKRMPGRPPKEPKIAEPEGK
jgi:hypothetical protein